MEDVILGSEVPTISTKIEPPRNQMIPQYDLIAIAGKKPYLKFLEYLKFHSWYDS